MYPRTLKSSRFYVEVNLYHLGKKVVKTVPFVAQLPAVSNANYPEGPMVILSTDEVGLTKQGLHVWTGKRWSYALSQVRVSEVVQKGQTLNVYYKYGEDVVLEEPTILYRNGVAITADTIPASSSSLYCHPFTPEPEVISDYVKSVDGVFPDDGGNVSLTQYVQYAVSVPYEPEPESSAFYQEIADTLTFESATALAKYPPQHSNIELGVYVNGNLEGNIHFPAATSEGAVNFNSDLVPGDVVEIIMPEDLREASTFSFVFVYRRA